MVQNVPSNNISHSQSSSSNNKSNTKPNKENGADDDNINNNGSGNGNLVKSNIPNWLDKHTTTTLHTRASTTIHSILPNNFLAASGRIFLLSLPRNGRICIEIKIWVNFQVSQANRNKWIGAIHQQQHQQHLSTGTHEPTNRTKYKIIGKVVALSRM